MPQIADGLQVRWIPATFLIHKGNVIDSFLGIPKDDLLEDFINTGLVLEGM